MPTNSANVLPQQDDVALRFIEWHEVKARKEQLEPVGDWLVWLIMSGRGWGKTRTGAEWLAQNAIRHPNTRWAIVAATYADGRDTCVEGESGILNILREYKMVDSLHPWNRSLGEITLLNNSKIKLFSAEEPERLRGPQHHGAWCDELAAWQYPEAWHQLQFGLRLGVKPQTVVTTTPKPIGVLKDLLKREDNTVVVTRGSTFENKENLAPSALLELRARYEGTRLGKQELYGEVLEDVEGALWTYNLIEKSRISTEPQLSRIVVAVDPAVTSTEESDETGIIVAGRDSNGQGYVLADYSFKGRPDAWAKKVVDAYDAHDCDSVIIEVNQGGDMVAQTLRTVRSTLPIKEVRAFKGKKLRAEPISAMYEQGRVHHVGIFEKLEEQMCTWTQDEPKSPDRLDALVHAMTDLMQMGGAQAYLQALAKMCSCGYPNIKNAMICAKCGKSF